MIFTKLDQHVNEIMTTAGKKFKNFRWSRFLIIVQNINMVTNGKRNSRLNPCVVYNRYSLKDKDIFSGIHRLIIQFHVGV